jgi:adenylate kinase
MFKGKSRRESVSAPTKRRLRPLNVLLLGPPGSGKGTQAKRMASEYRLTHIEPGEIFRAAIAARTPIGVQIQPIVAAGKLVPDSLTIELIRGRLSRLGPDEGFVLDGFPRTIAQAEHLDQLLDEIRRPLSIVFEFQLPDHFCVERLSARAQEGRIDDTRETIEQRLAIYHRETEPIVERYVGKGLVVTIRAERSIGEVWRQVRSALERHAR